MTLDLVIKGGTVATASDVFDADIGVRDGRVVAMGEDLTAPDVIDATGKLVLPGGIEAHCHIAQESAAGIMTADDYYTGSVSGLGSSFASSIGSSLSSSLAASSSAPSSSGGGFSGGFSGGGGGGGGGSGW